MLNSFLIIVMSMSIHCSILCFFKLKTGLKPVTSGSSLAKKKPVRTKVTFYTFFKKEKHTGSCLQICNTREENPRYTVLNTLTVII